MILYNVSVVDTILTFRHVGGSSPLLHVCEPDGGLGRLCSVLCIYSSVLG